MLPQLHSGKITYWFSLFLILFPTFNERHKGYHCALQLLKLGIGLVFFYLLCCEDSASCIFFVSAWFILLRYV